MNANIIYGDVEHTWEKVGGLRIRGLIFRCRSSEMLLRHPIGDIKQLLNMGVWSSEMSALLTYIWRLSAYTMYIKYLYGHT